MVTLDYMAQVDPNDDTIRRFIVWHYRYDPSRQDRRNVVVAAFDNAHEFEDFLTQERDVLRLRQAANEADDRENIGGVIHEAGHQARAQQERLLSRGARHAARPPS